MTAGDELLMLVLGTQKEDLIYLIIFCQGPEAVTTTPGKLPSYLVWIFTRTH